MSTVSYTLRYSTLISYPLLHSTKLNFSSILSSCSPYSFTGTVSIPQCTDESHVLRICVSSTVTISSHLMLCQNSFLHVYSILLLSHSSFHFFMLTIALCSLYFSFFQIFSTPSSSSFPLFSTVLCFFLDSISHSLLHGHHSAQADIAPIRHRTGNHSHTRTEPQMSHHATLFTSTHGNFSFYILCIHFSHHVVLLCFTSCSPPLLHIM